VTGAHAELFAELLPLLPDEAPGATISVGAQVSSWLTSGPRVFAGADRVALDALCRQIDVRKKVSASYADGWKRAEPEVPAAPPVVAGVVAVLLANGERIDEPTDAGALNDGWACKCANSALKALDLCDDLPFEGELRVWAMEALDRVRRTTPEAS
jgi:hypothetical protein